MHVELRSNITVDMGVDVLQMVSTGVLVESVGFRIRSVEISSAAATGSKLSAASKDGGRRLSTPHELRHQGIAKTFHFYL